MARGWESKAVEAQIELAENKPRRAKRLLLSAEQIIALRQRESLELSRTRIRHLIENTQNPRYLSQLEKQLADLDARIGQLA